MQAQGGKVIVREKLLHIPRTYNCALRRRGARVPPKRYNCTRAPPTRGARARHLNKYLRAPQTRRARTT